MPYFTHLRRMSYLGVVELDDKLYIDGQAYDLDTLARLDARLDVISPTPTFSNFFSFGTPTLALARTSVICTPDTLQGVDLQNPKVLDSTILTTGKARGKVGVVKDANTKSYFFSEKYDPSGANGKLSVIRQVDQFYSFMSKSSPQELGASSAMLTEDDDYVLAEDGSYLSLEARNDGYRIASVFLETPSLTLGATSSKVFGINCKYIYDGTSDSNEAFSFDTSSASTYASSQVGSKTINQLVFLDVDGSKTGEKTGLFGRAKIGYSSNASHDFYSLDLTTGGQRAVDVDLPRGTSHWVQSFQGSGSIEIRGIQIDANKNLYCVGAIATSSNKKQIWIAKVAASGNVLWEKSFGGGENDIATGALIDSANNVFVVGDIGTSASSSDIFIAKMDASGTVLWQKILGGEGSRNGQGVALDAYNNVYVSGTVPPVSAYQFRQAFLAKFDPSGALLWQRSLLKYTVNSFTNGAAVMVDGNNNPTVIGQTERGESAIIRFDSNGEVLSARDCYGVSVFSARMDSSGYIYAAGGASGAAVVLKIAPTDTVIWRSDIKEASSPLSTGAASICLAADGGMYFAGSSVSGGITTGVFARIEPSGDIGIARRFSVSGQSTSLYGVATDNDGSVYVSGMTNIDSALGSFLAKMPINGSGVGYFNVISSSIPATKQIRYSEALMTRTSGSSTISPWPGFEKIERTFTEAATAYAPDDVTSTVKRIDFAAVALPLPDYVNCLFSNAEIETVFGTELPCLFVPACSNSPGSTLELYIGRFVTLGTSPLIKFSRATVSNPSNLSLTVHNDIYNRNMRPFLFKNSAGQMYLGVLDYYSGTVAADNRSSLMVFSIAQMGTGSDSVTLAYQQRLDLSEAGNGFITSAMPTSDDMRTWVVSYGDKFKVVSWTAGNAFSVAQTANWGRAGEADSFGIDSKNRLWFTTDRALSFIPLDSSTAPNTAVKGYFENTSVSHEAGAVTSTLYVYSRNLYGERESRSVTATLVGNVTFADNTKTKTFTTSASADTAIPVKVTGKGLLQVKFS